ncbi:stigma-specific STIG1-like protein 1 [Pyrus x bretschneideri]|uniref:stigma-specific STIG1-like protein 1 n=1 Tax=Pyrus x bretschneideri TaxID=225117 RepID=UPI00202E1AB3|nr:stigma-specific STIG1-like protein 1 [Pyrus x bretschneideri]
MEVIKIILVIATTMALSITLMTVKRVGYGEEEQEGKTPFTDSWKQQPEVDENTLLLPSKRVSRFLAENDLVDRNPRAADHCHKDNEVCAYTPPGYKNSTCCNNKCLDLSEDKNNCGACKKKCKYTESCCRGECVNTNYDKRHCGQCNSPCKFGQYCVYGLCNYA